MIQKISEFCRTNNIIRPHETIIVGVSGGADSVCLLLVLRELQKELDFEGAWFVGAAPSSGYGEVGFLAQAQRTVGIEVFEVDGTVPIAVPVAGRCLPASGNAVCAADVAPHIIVVEVVVVGGNGEYGEGVSPCTAAPRTMR